MPSQSATDGGGTGPFVVRCPDYIKRFPTVEQAEAWVRRLTEGRTCRHDHVIEDTSCVPPRIV